jgi:hypothetical protein
MPTDKKERNRHLDTLNRNLIHVVKIYRNLLEKFKLTITYKLAIKSLLVCLFVNVQGPYSPTDKNPEG